MAYEPHTWVTKEKITAEKLNHMEQGIVDASTSSGSGGTEDPTGVGQSMGGKEVSTGYEETSICGEGSEIFNNYQEREYDEDGWILKGNSALGKYSHAEGNLTTASGDNSHAEGDSTTASGNGAHAEGYQGNASGSDSHVEGVSCTASGEASHAGGFVCRATNSGAYAHGWATQAKGEYSIALGQGTIAAANKQTVIGSFNVESSNPNDRFIVGNGTNNSNCANCFRINETGVFGSGNYNASGADYAELMEWADGNPDNEDRIGLFVILVSNKIRIAKPGDKKILGIVSGNPSVVGDVYDDQWQGMYLHDIFGRPIWEDVMVPNETIEIPDPQNPSQMITEIVQPAHMEHRQKLNPNYDHTKKYIPRSERPEWDAVGMIGKLVAIDDGTCEPGGYCTVGYDDGVATYTDEETKFNVMERIDNTHIRVMIIP